MTMKQFAIALGTATLACILGTSTTEANVPSFDHTLLEAEETLAQARVEPVRYRMTDAWLSLTDTYIIRDSDGDTVFTINGRLISLNGQMIFKDTEGRELARIQNKIFDIIDTIQITRDREVVAEIRPVIISPLRQSYIIDVPGVGQLVARGDFINHEYEIRGRDSDRIVATVTRRFISLRNAYDIEIMPLRRDQRIEDDVFFIAAAAAIDLLENTDEEPDSPVVERPPVVTPPAPVVICNGTMAGSDLTFEAVSASEGGFSSINFIRNEFPVTSAQLDLAGKNSLNQDIWRGQADGGTTNVILTHLSTTPLQASDTVSVVYNGQGGQGDCSSLTAQPPVEQPPFRDTLVLNCLGTVAGSNIDFSTLYSPEGGFARVSFSRDGTTTATAELTFDGRNDQNQMVWRGAVNGMTDVTLTHLSDQMIQVRDRISVIYDGQEGLGTCLEYQP